MVSLLINKITFLSFSSSLSARHDSEGNSCNGDDGFIMSAVSKIHLGATAINPWIFSTCSTNYFTSKLDNLDS